MEKKKECEYKTPPKEKGRLQCPACGEEVIVWETDFYYNPTKLCCMHCNKAFGVRLNYRGDVQIDMPINGQKAI